MSSSRDDEAGHDKPWCRPGRARYALARLAGVARPDISVYRPEPGRVRVENDRPVVTREGTVLRVNAGPSQVVSDENTGGPVWRMTR
ncbi:hypothetical protein [Streptomyces sp. MJM1172]|uniref:hypothetical protein n=1 Tax=Streptomyces sp. MJM1172 TaxID=1703926 RepID=UPI000AE01BDA|nr:hypothetical protein [Streptomyces sp. MJM1172]